MAENKEMLVPVELYLKAGIHIGTKFKSAYMEPFIYKIRPDGLFILNLEKVDERIFLAAKMLAHYEPQDILVVSRRENGWKPIKTFAKITGVTVFAGRYPPGILTNTSLKSFMEKKIVLVTDPWPDKNAVEDASRVGIPVIALCDTNNQSNNVDLVVPCNNKGKKSLGLFFMLLAREYLKAKGLIKKNEEFTQTLEDFAEAD
ncbi:MAG: 30S ribosomal protein S2 [Nanoarchaeota archaeon]